MVNVIVAVAEEKLLIGACVAVITVEPNASGVTTFPTNLATAEFEALNVQAPGEDEVGGMSERLATLSFIIVILPKGPRAGLIAITVSVIGTETEFQFTDARCVAVITTVPPSNKVTVLPETRAICGFEELKDQSASEVDVGAVRVKVFAVICTDCAGNTPTVGVPALTRS